MAWTKKDVGAPVFNDLANAAGAAAGALGAIAASGALAAGAVAVASSAHAAKADPLAAAFSTVVQSLQNLLNDTFGAGVFVLVVNQFDVPGVRPVDNFGIPILYPREALQMAMESFDDTADANRPQFSDDAQVTAYGFMATASSVAGIITLIDELLRVFNIAEWNLINQRFRNAILPPSPTSVYPDWQSLRLNSISQIAGVQKSANQMLENLRGNTLDTHDAVRDVVQTLKEKVETADSIVSQLKNNLTSLQNAAKASGLYVLNVPPGPGGNTRLKNEIFDCNLVLENSGYTVVAITVGGGPTLIPVDTVRRLTVGG